MARSRVTTLLRGLFRSVLRSSAEPDPAPPGARPSAGARPPTRARPAPAAEPTTGDPTPGRFGPSATVEVDPRRIGPVRMTYSPRTDGDPDPGEIVWTWVPYAERDGRGKDRPVLVVAVEKSRTVLAVQLTSKAHDGDGEFVPLGSGDWDREGRPSWVNLERVFRVSRSGMRREATALDEKRFAAVRTALVRRYSWR